MAKINKPKPKRREEVCVVPNFGFIYVLDRELQKQLDDLGETKRLNTDNKKVRKIIGKPK